MRSINRHFITTVALSLSLAAAIGCVKAPNPNDPPTKANVGGNKPVTVQTLDFDGIQQFVASKKGKVVVMDGWSTSCQPCLKEFHHLVELHKKYAGEIACISLSFDFEGIGKPEEQLPGVEKFLTEQGATFDNLISNEESDQLYRKFKLASIPAVFVYDKSGKLRHRFDSASGHYTYDDVGKLVEELNKE